MKKLLSLCVAVLAMHISMAQSPVSWTYSAKKISDNVYEIHLKANIQQDWHLYAQEQPGSFLGSPTAIKFNKHPLVILSGKTKEIGEMEKTTEPVLNSEAWQYSEEVDFVQEITVKRNNIKTTISGNIEFQVCTGKVCLPPATVSFSVALN